MRKRVLWSIALLAVLLVGGGRARADVHVQCPPDTDGIDTDGDGVANNDHLCLHVAAGDGFAVMADGRPLYIFGFSSVHEMAGMTLREALMHNMVGAEWPAPTIVAREGQKVYLTLTNVGMMMRPDLFDPHTIHWHGFPNAAPIFDGMPDAAISINMGSSLTYFYNVVEPGTYMYHCHVEAAEHMQMGMLGNLYVRPRQDNLPDGTDLRGFTHRRGFRYAYNDGDGSTRHDVSLPLQLGSFDPNFHDASESVQPLPFALMKDTYAMMNGRGYPDTVNPAPLPNANDHLAQLVPSGVTLTQGQRLLVRASSLSTTDFFTITALGLPMRVVGQCAKLLRADDPDGDGPLEGADLTYETASVTLGGGQSMDILVDTTGVPPGTYFLYTTNLNFLSNDAEDQGGMMTEIVVRAPSKALRKAPLRSAKKAVATPRFLTRPTRALPGR